MPRQVQLPQKIRGRDRQKQQGRDRENHDDLQGRELSDETGTARQRLRSRFMLPGVEHFREQQTVRTFLTIHEMGFESRTIPRAKLVIEVPVGYRMLFDIAMVHQEIALGFF